MPPRKKMSSKASRTKRLQRIERLYSDADAGKGTGRHRKPSSKRPQSARMKAIMTADKQLRGKDRVLLKDARPKKPKKTKRKSGFVDRVAQRKEITKRLGY